MHLDWSIPIGTVILVAIQFVGGVVGMMRAFAAIERSIESRFSEMNLILNTFKEGDLRDIHGRLVRLEGGQDDWTRELRKRTHDHDNRFNVIELKVDRLERPDRYRGRNSDPTPSEGA